MKRKSFKKKHFVILSIILFLLAIRIVLPYIVLKLVNKKLANLTEYYGHVDDINIRLYRGAYQIIDLNLFKINKERIIISKTPLINCPLIDLSLEWRALFKGRIVGKVYFEAPKIYYINGNHKNENVKKDTSELKNVSNSFMPLSVNVFRAKYGQIHYIDPNLHPKLDISMTNIIIEGNNISNVNDSNKLLPARLTALGDLYNGTFRLNVDYNILKKYPTFYLKTELKNINMVKLNDMLNAYGNFNIIKGEVGMYSEFAARDGKFGGYIKPFILNMEVGHYDENNEKVKSFWEILIGIGATILRNPKTKAIATKIQIDGRFDDPYVNTWRAISIIIRNAFVKALQPSIENSISINNLKGNDKKTLLEKIFSGKKAKKALK